MQITKKDINTWISPKIKNQNNDNLSNIETEKVKFDKPVRVNADVALASLGVVAKTTSTQEQSNIKSSNVTGELISDEMLNGQSGNVTSIFYVNDIHGRLSNMERITTASLNFDKTMPSYVDTLKFSAGDIMLGSSLSVNQAANSFLNANNFMANVIGNHEVDQNIGDFLTATQDAVYKVMGANTDIDKSTKLYNRVIDSYIQEDKDSNKYAIIALMPFDLELRSSNKALFDVLEVKQKEETIQYLQNEIARYSDEGINRVIVLSHIGYQNDIDIAKSVQGIDIIIGGHSHDLVDDLTVGDNLIISKESGAPTIITQAGRDGNYYGILNVQFDDNGEIIKAENIVKPTSVLERNLDMQKEFNKFLGEPEIVGRINSAAEMPKNNLKEENPHASFLTDIMRKKYDTDIALINAGTIRGAFSSGDISTRDIGEIFPFKDKIAVIDITEEKLVQAVK
ncbi:bifunctional metallophosphatase/5'-nucleotidase, partial [bacterium]|nr:bifunctional metallophosphatase/5'-nucleotidase [bacterium]